MGKPQYAGIFKHKFRQEYPNKPCVYKIWASDHFFIWKCQALHNSMYHIGGDIERRVRLGPKPGHAFSGLVEYIISDNINELEVEVVLMSENPFDLLKFEYELLCSNKWNQKCLNRLFSPHIPGWINDEYIKQYNDFLTTKNETHETRNG